MPQAANAPGRPGREPSSRNGRAGQAPPELSQVPGQPGNPHIRQRQSDVKAATESLRTALGQLPGLIVARGYAAEAFRPTFA